MRRRLENGDEPRCGQPIRTGGREVGGGAMGAAAAARVESQTVPNMLLLQETFVKIVSPKDHPKVIMSVKIFLHFHHGGYWFKSWL